jgi:iron complex outermembrane recepter protein
MRKKIRAMVRGRILGLEEYNMRRTVSKFVVLLAGFFAYPTISVGENDLTQMSFEELMKVQVTSVSKRNESAHKTAAAIYVITSEDIRRSSATTIPELLRLVPGLHVAQINATQWAISARGFNGVFADKLLVLVDGRSIYSPLFSGVFWDSHDLVLQDIDRIEVIRGPGASVWGANAVNGVINIITKKATDTLGGVTSVGGGVGTQRFGEVRYGSMVGEETAVRAYAKYRSIDGFDRLDGSEGENGSEYLQGGFRYDREAGGTRLSVQGSSFLGEHETEASYPRVFPPYSEYRNHDTDVRGGSLLARYMTPVLGDDELTVQFYGDRYLRDDYPLDELVTTLDGDIQYQFSPLLDHTLTSGLEYRTSSLSLPQQDFLTAEESEYRMNLLGAFLQDSIEVIPDTVTFTLGTKFEYHEYVGPEWQPSTRVSWTPSQNTTVWSAFSRAVDTPSFGGNNLRVPYFVVPGGPVTTSFDIFPNRSQQAVVLHAYELGLRTEPFRDVMIDVVGFVHRYPNAEALYALSPIMESRGSEVYSVVPLTLSNRGEISSCGIETTLTWKPSARWTSQLWYSSVEMDSRVNDPHPGEVVTYTMDQNARHQVGVRSLFDLSETLQVDLFGRYVDEVPAFDIDSYVAVDARLGWKLSNKVDLSLVGKNLLDGEHREYDSTFIQTPQSRIPRGIYGMIQWRF